MKNIEQYSTILLFASLFADFILLLFVWVTFGLNYAILTVLLLGSIEVGIEWRIVDTFVKYGLLSGDKNNTKQS